MEIPKSQTNSSRCKIQFQIDENYSFGWDKVKEIRHDDVCNIVLMSPEFSLKSAHLVFAAVSNHVIKIFSSIMGEDTVYKIGGHEKSYLNSINSVCWNADGGYLK